jgi:hypothetical protein
VPSADWVAWVSFWASVATVVALPPSIVAVLYAARQLTLGRRATSAGAVVPLNESLRQAWLQFKGANNEADVRYAFADIANLLELGCAIFHDRLLVGRVGELLEEYLCGIFRMIQTNNDAHQRMVTLLQTEQTFKNIVEFLAKHRREVQLELPARTSS